MSLRKAGQVLFKKRTLVLATMIVAVAAATAIAASFNGDGTIIGTSGNDSITAGNGNDTVYGLAGSDSISAGNGNDVIDGDGKCDPGVSSGVYPSGLHQSGGCEHGQVDGPGQTDTISAGNGSDTVFGGGGNDTISVGSGTDTIYGSNTGNTTISTGSRGSATVWLGTGTNNVAIGKSPISAVIHAYIYGDTSTDTINCNGGNSTAYVNTQDKTSNCATVVKNSDLSTRPTPLPARDLRSIRRLKKTTHLKKTKRAARLHVLARRGM